MKPTESQRKAFNLLADLTEPQREILRLWAQETAYAPDAFFLPRDVFSARNAMDNARCRMIYRLAERGVIEWKHEGSVTYGMHLSPELRRALISES